MWFNRILQAVPWTWVLGNAVFSALFYSVLWALFMSGHEDTGSDFRASIIAYGQVVLAALLAGIAAVEARRPILQGHIDRSGDRIFPVTSRAAKLWVQYRSDLSLQLGSNTVASLDRLVAFERDQSHRRIPDMRRLRSLCVQAKVGVASDVRILDLTFDLTQMLERLHSSLGAMWDEYAKQRARQLRAQLSAIDGTLLWWSFVMLSGIFAHDPFFGKSAIHTCFWGFCAFDWWNSALLWTFDFLGANQTPLRYDVIYVAVIVLPPAVLVTMTVWQTRDINLLRPLPDNTFEPA